MSNEEIAVREEFVCIECFQSIKSIFKIYQDGFKDIIQCVNYFLYLEQNVFLSGNTKF